MGGKGKRYLVTIYSRPRVRQRVDDVHFLCLDVRLDESGAIEAADELVMGNHGGLLFQAEVPGFTKEDAVAALLLAAFKNGTFVGVNVLLDPVVEGLQNLPPFTFLQYPRD